MEGGREEGGGYSTALAKAQTSRGTTPPSSALPPLSLSTLHRFSGATLPSIFSSSSTIACFLKLEEAEEEEEKKEEKEELSCVRAECVRRSRLSLALVLLT